MTDSIIIRPAVTTDLDALLRLEQTGFASDRLSKRRFRHWITAANGLLLVAESENVIGYGLVLLHKGTRLARMYSLVTDSACQGRGVAQQLIEALEQQAANSGRLFMRLEVAVNNARAIALYQRLGYRKFGEYTDYYEDHSDALRMQKRIRHPSREQIFTTLPWYQQTTDFTCGPASLLMAMASLEQSRQPTQQEELDIWRESTTIFMTSGHGGCHPVGLALAAHHRGFAATVYINTDKPLFVEGVRSSHKKDVMAVVDQQFHSRAREQNIDVAIADISQQQIEQWLQTGYAVIVLISTYHMNGRKAPHWVTVTAMDELCFYVHDPDPEEDQEPMDCQHIPIARDDFARMSQFGNGKLRTAVAIRKCC